ncbi:MAG: family 43 glycosylhydrolase [Bacteroidales bacterium]|jgi:hypothetical protein|nr:family 43 glycosylhydrolase [Bacteroidales bacterium]
MTTMQAQTDNKRIVANPMDLNYRFQFDEPSRREAADPVCEYFNGKYYLFASKSGGYWSSADLTEWTYIRCTTLAVQENYAPTILVWEGKLYYFASGSTRIFYTENPDVDAWQELVPSRFSYSVTDPAFFKDDDTGKVYIYWGCSDKDPIMGVEVDPANGFKAIGTPSVLIEHNGDKYGWEVPGNDNNEKRTGWNEGPCMIKYSGKYYLQYAAPGTEYRIYADGIYVSDHPLGPFTYMENSPFSIKPGGFIGGAGHGHTFLDVYGNYWHVASMRISVRHQFERRLGLFPVYFDDNDNLYAHTVWTDYPFIIPNKKIGSEYENCSTNWNLLSYKKQASASSVYAGYIPENANNEEIENWWAAQTGNIGEWWQVDLGKSMKVNAIQVNFADQDFTVKAPNSSVFYQYKIEISNDGGNWELFIDRSQNTADRPHELIVAAEPSTARYFRIVNATNMNGRFSLSGFRIFGKGSGEAHAGEVSGIQARRQGDDRRRIQLTWDKQENATGYVVRWGISADRLNNASMVFANQLEAGYFNRDSEYYFAVDAFNENGVTRGNTAVKGEVFRGTPYQGILRSVPGTVEAIDYNEGGQGFAYWDKTAGNVPGQYRPCESVDIDYDDMNDDFFVSQTETGEYINYTVNVTQSGWYDIDCIAVSPDSKNGELQLAFDDVNIEKITVPLGYRLDFKTTTIPQVFLTEGTQVMTVYPFGNMNIKRFVFHLKTADIQQTPDDSSFSIYPEGNGIFMLHLLQPAQIALADINGHIIHSEQTKNSTSRINLSHVTTGVYLISLQTDSQIYHCKLIKQ